WDSWIADQREREKESLGAGIVLPRLEEEFQIGFGSIETAVENLRISGRLCLDVIELADLSEPHEATTDESGAGPTESDERKSHQRAVVRVNADLHAIREGGSSKPGFDFLQPKFSLWKKQGFKTLVLASTPSQMDRLRYLFNEKDIPISTSEREPLT